jgi:ABC-type transport system substrate-binding protein
VFNTTNPLFEKAEVRRALSIAIDRNEIVNIITFAKPATGYIPEGVFDANRKSDFRTVGGELISASANVEEAKSLLKSAGVNGGSFTLTVRNREVDLAIADYVKGVWESLGFNVKIEKVKAKVTSEDKTYIADDVFQTKYDTSDFDVIAIDMTMLAPDAYSALAQYSLEFSGNGVDMNSETYDLYGHVSGYNSEAYDALIESAYAERDRAARVEILHDAEEMLLNDMPVIPLVVLQDAYLAIGDLKKLDTTYYGIRDFKGAELKNYMNYKDLTEGEE